MNASASTLPREGEVRSKVRKIRRFGRSARVVCMALLAFGLPLVVGGLIYLASWPIGKSISGGGGGPYSILAAALTPLQIRTLLVVQTSVGFGLWLAAVHQLYRLFGSLAAGAIYTSENVRRVRNVGLLWLLLAALDHIVFPAALIVMNGVVGASVPMRLLLPISTAAFKAVAAAGLVLLASWIMAVGLHEKANADALQRDAELTI